MSRSGRYWKRFFDIAAPSFVAVYVYLMISASHNSRRGLVLSTHDWKTKFLLCAIIPVALSIVWIVAMFSRRRRTSMVAKNDRR